MRRTPSTTLCTLLRSPPRGAAIVEFALILPFLILLMAGLFDLGFGAYQTMQVQAAAEAGAQYALRHNWDATAIATAVTSATGTGGSSACPPANGKLSACPLPSQVCGCTDNNTFRLAGAPTGGSCASAVPACTGGFGVYASVSAQLSYSPVLPYPGLPDPITLTGLAYRRLN